MGKGSQATGGYWYRPAFHIGLGARMDAFLGVTAAGKTAWSGNVMQSGYIHIEAPNLFGGQDDQGGISGDLQISFGEPTQQPDPYLKAVFSQRGLSIVNSQFWNQFLTDLKAGKPIAADLQDAQIPAWRGLATVSFRGGWYGANNPYPQKPSFLFRAIKVGWEGDVNWDGSACWYPEKAEIAFGTTYAYDDIWKYRVEEPGSTADYSSPTYDDSAWTTGPGGFGSTAQGPQGVGTYIAAGEVGKTIWLRRTIPSTRGVAFELDVYHDDGAWVWWNGYPIALTATADVYHSTAVVPGNLVGDSNVVVLKVMDSVPSGTPSAIYAALALHPGSGTVGMNPAHILYYARTHSELGRDPVEAIDDASFRTGADWFYNQGIGFCTAYDPGSESVDDLTQRISKVAGCSVNRSPVDGKWYLDIANGVYDLASLPILTDDDVLDFSETPTTLDSAVNSVSVEYYDPIADTTVLTPPVEAMSLIDSFGRNHQDIQYHEVPTAALATRFAQRDEQSFVTPTRKFDLTTTRKTYAWRRNTYFRLQLRKRGIADMVCIIAGIESGTLKSGAMKLTVAQDTYSLPTTSFVQVDPGIDTRPSQIPLVIANQAAFEAPYFEVARNLSRADLQALPTDVGYLLTVAQDPATSLHYSVIVSTDGGATFAGSSNAAWCPSALIVEGDTLDAGLKTGFTITNGTLLESVAVGSAALWVGADHAEVCRVDAIDAAANTLTLGRGCADTPPCIHAANARIWFFDGFTGTDSVEYTDGQTIDVKLLTNTGSQQLDPSLATAIALTFDQRQFRPYPPGNLTINGSRYPAAIGGADGLTLTWAKRGRIVQADQLVDTTAADTSPEAGQSATLRIYGNADELIHTEAGLTAGGFAYSTAAETVDMGGGAAADPSWNNVISLLHLNGANGSTLIQDDKGKGWVANGTAKIDTTRSRFGGASLLLDGTGFGIYSTDVTGTGPGSGDFTYECFVYRTNTITTEQVLVCLRNAAISSFGNTLAIKNGYLAFSNGTNWTTSSSVVPLNAFAHVAVARASGTLRMFIDGAVVYQGTIANNFPDPDRIVVGAYDNSLSYTFTGSIDEVRLTNGVARYVAAFTPPAAPFPGQNTQALNGRLRIELESARDGLASLRHHNVVVRRAGYGFNYGMFYGGKA